MLHQFFIQVIVIQLFRHENHCLSEVGMDWVDSIVLEKMTKTFIIAKTSLLEICCFLTLIVCSRTVGLVSMNP